MKFGKIVVVAIILAFAGLAFAQQAQDQKKKPAKQSRTMVKKDEAAKMSKEECAKMGKEECAKMSKEECAKMGKEGCSKMSKEECAKMGKEGCSKMENMKAHGSMECCSSDSTKSTAR